MSKIVECVPNYSEGRDKAIIEAIANECRSVEGINLLDYSADASHNRSVFTFVGTPEAVEEAAFRMTKIATEKIDMRKHSGEHPRMGATDVIPFVPVKDVTVAECVEISERLAKRMWEELGIPVFLYEDSCKTEKRRNLATCRKGQFEGMPEKLLQDEWAPDFGERKIHPTAGITAVGARKTLVAFNVNLNTADIDIANKIAKGIRASGGGYKYCKAIGIMLEDRNIAQVSMNMVDFEGTPLYRVYETIKFEAARWGVNIIGSEIIGAVPAKALCDAAEYYMQIENFDFKSQVFENRLLG